MTLTLRDPRIEAALRGELACQSSHLDPRNKVCSGKVTHLDLTPCAPGGAPRFVCEQHADWVKRAAKEDAWACHHCARMCHTHWRVRPI